MPVERRRKTKTPKEVPDAGPDRKRVLNVLAQRRYRQRQREKIAALEAQARGSSAIQPLGHTPGDCSTSNESAQTCELQALQNVYSASAPIVPLEQEVVENELIVLTGEECQDVEEIFRQPSMSDIFEAPMGEFPVDTHLFSDLYTYGLPSPIQIFPTSSSSDTTETSSNSEPSLNFPLSADGAQLQVPILSAIQAFAKIGSVLNIISSIWDPEFQHVLSPIPVTDLPPNFRPTPAQLTVPHHPFIDALPWPSVREKLICVLAMPSAFRPTIAQNEDAASQGQSTAVMRLVQDMDDYRDSIRVHGNTSGWGNENELVEEAWEVGERFYRNWWWCLDEKVVQRANKWRRERGEQPLKMQ